MFPISAIAAMAPAYGMRAQPGISPPDPTPEIQGPLPAAAPAEAGAVQPAGESFAHVLGRMVQEVNARQGAAAEAVSGLQSGQGMPLHQAVIAMEEANVSFQLMVEVRNKLLDSYQELMRMQI